MGSKKKRHRNKKNKSELIRKKGSSWWLVPTTIMALLSGDYVAPTLQTNISKTDSFLQTSTTKVQEPALQLLRSFNNPLTPIEIEKIVKDLFQVYDTRESPLITVKIDSSFNQHHASTISRTERNNKILTQSDNAISDIVDFCNSDYLSKPSFKLVMPASIDEVIFKRDTPTIYFLNDLKLKEITYLTLIYEDSKTLSITTSEEKIEDAFVNVQPKVDTTDGVVSFKTNRNCILINVNASFWRLYSKPAGEALHYIIGVYTDQHIEKEIDFSTSFSSYMNIANKWMNREEGLVHAIQVSWLMDRRHIYDLSEERINDWFNNFTKRKAYTLTPSILEKIHESNVEDVINLYVNNPEALFSNEQH